MQWSNTKVAQRYMHVLASLRDEVALASLRDEVATKVGGFIWGAT